jgi:hypothetical protein
MAAPVSTRSWFALDADADADAGAVVGVMDSDPESGLSAQEAASRVARIGPSQIAREKPPSHRTRSGVARTPLRAFVGAVEIDVALTTPRQAVTGATARLV